MPSTYTSAAFSHLIITAHNALPDVHQARADQRRTDGWGAERAAETLTCMSSLSMCDRTQLTEPSPPHTSIRNWSNFLNSRSLQTQRYSMTSAKYQRLQTPIQRRETAQPVPPNQHKGCENIEQQKLSSIILLILFFNLFTPSTARNTQFED